MCGGVVCQKSLSGAYYVPGPFLGATNGLVSYTEQQQLIFRLRMLSKKIICSHIHAFSFNFICAL